jgi:hypothetical protein
MMGWYLVPYVGQPGVPGVARTLDFNVTMPVLEEDAAVSEVEIDHGTTPLGQALVKVRGSATLQAAWAARYPLLTDPVAAWTPTRTTPRALDGAFAWSAQAVPTPPIRAIDQSLLDDMAVEQAKGLCDAYIAQAVAHGRVRIPSTLDRATVSYILQRAGRLGFGLDRISPGTFPTQGVVDDFNRADSTGLGANWSTSHFLIGSNNTDVLSNAAVIPTTNNSYPIEYWNASTFGPDAECYFTVVAYIGSSGFDCPCVLVRMANPGSGTLDGYWFYPSLNDDTSGLLERWDNGSRTTLGATFTCQKAAGDKLGAEMIGDQLVAYRWTSGGGWATLATRTDGTYTAAGFIGWMNTRRAAFANTLDDFSGGTVGAGGGPSPGAMFRGS